MKRLISYLILLGLLLGSGLCHAQRNSFDHDILAIRNNALPDFRFTYDDYMQYSPAAVMLGIKAFGYEGRSSWGRMLVSDSFSTAIMAATVNSLKYTVQRPRPDGSRNNSFPSGHTATSFMTATMLHMEYGWRSPWFSIGAYTVATASGVSRILNNKHWMTDIVGGAAVGIGAVHLGYYLTDLIFKDKGLSGSYSKPPFSYDSGLKHYVAELSFGHRHFFLPKGSSGMPYRGGAVSLSTDIPLVPNIGFTLRGTANSLIYGSAKESENMYSAAAGGYWNFFQTGRFEFQAHALAGGAWIPDGADNSADSSGLRADLTAGLAASLFLDNNFKLKIFADYETVSSPAGNPRLNSLLLGWSSAWFW